MESKKRMQLMFNVQNDTIINNIMRGLKPMFNKIKSMFENVLEYIAYSLFGYKEDIQLNFSIILKQKKKIKSLEEQTKLLKETCEYYAKKIAIDESIFTRFSPTINTLENKINNLEKALELSIAMSKCEHDNLKASFNKYVLRPKAEEILKEDNNIDIVKNAYIKLSREKDNK